MLFCLLLEDAVSFERGVVEVWDLGNCRGRHRSLRLKDFVHNLVG